MSTDRPVVRLLADRLAPGPWVYGRQVEPPEAAVEDGSLVEVYDSADRFVGQGLFNSSSDIRIRILSRGKKSELRQPRDFLLRALASADRLRRKVLRLPETTDAYRIAHAEGDDLPGLIVDRLGSCIVCEYHARGFWRLREDVEWALGQLYPGLAIVHRVPPNAARNEGFAPEESPTQIGTVHPTENGITYSVRPGFGHKTGFFCDQRDNRLQIGALAKGLDVLDVCTNSGGFALQAARAGARSVRAVDLDEVVLELARATAAANHLPVEFRHEDGFDTLRAVRTERERPGLVILDPHKIIRSKGDLDEGLRKYNDWNTLALQAVRPGGLLATFSCSGSLDLPGFMGVIFQAARRAEREIRLLRILEAGPDHPQRPDFPRSRYLKGALLAVE